jgi:hypothetical protein
MPLKPSSLSFACGSVRAFLASRLEGVPADIEVVVGSPGGEQIPGDKNALNLFFYRFEPAGFGPLARPDEPWRLRVHCLVSAFGVLFDSVSAGDNELRMLGEVMRLFHETPILAAEEFLPPGDFPGQTFRVEAIFHPMEEETLGQFWSAHTAAEGRSIAPSVAYEFSLVPVVPERRRIDPPLVGALGAETRADRAGRHAPATVIPAGPPVAAQTIDHANPLWEPRLCWIVGETCQLTHTLSTADAPGFMAQVWIAGDPAASVELVWEHWRGDAGWERPGTPATSAQPATTFLDPAALPASVAGSFPFPLALPDVLDGADAAQLLLYARRTVPQPGGPDRVLRSNPLLLSLFTP